MARPEPVNSHCPQPRPLPYAFGKTWLDVPNKRVKTRRTKAFKKVRQETVRILRKCVLTNLSTPEMLSAT